MHLTIHRCLAVSTTFEVKEVFVYVEEPVVFDKFRNISVAPNILSIDWAPSMTFVKSIFFIWVGGFDTLNVLYVVPNWFTVIVLLAIVYAPSVLRTIRLLVELVPFT